MAKGTFNSFTEDDTVTFTWHHNYGVFYVQPKEGTNGFGSGTLTVKYSLDEGTSWDLVSADATFDATTFVDVKGISFDFPSGAKMQIALTGSTEPNLLYAISA